MFSSADWVPHSICLHPPHHHHQDSVSPSAWQQSTMSSPLTPAHRSDSCSSHLPQLGWLTQPGTEPQLALVGSFLGQRGGGENTMRFTNGTFFILGFSYLCLPSPWHLKLPVSLKPGGMLPPAHSYITHYFQLNTGNISCYQDKFENCWPLDSALIKSSVWCSASPCLALYLTHAFFPSLHHLLHILQSPSVNAYFSLQPSKPPFLLSSPFSLPALSCFLWTNRRAGYSPP